MLTHKFRKLGREILKLKSRPSAESLLTPEEMEIRKRCLGSLHEFVKWGWELIDPDPFYDNWHIEGLCLHLEEWIFERIKGLIGTVPPRTAKTTICYVFCPVWAWISHTPALTFTFCSYSEERATTSSQLALSLMQHPKFLRIFGDLIELRRHPRNDKIGNVSGGEIRAVPLKGTTLGFGARYIMIDDPNNFATIYSTTLRSKENKLVSYIFGTRTRSASPSYLLTQQRVDIDDATAMLLRNDIDKMWVHYRVPELFDPETRCVTIPLKGSKKPWQDPRTKKGEMLDPKWRNEKFILQRRLILGEADFECQFQQNPCIADGTIFSPDWFRIWTDEYPSFEYVIQSWDTAFVDGKETSSSYSCCTTWGVFITRDNIKNVILLDVFTDRLKMPDLRNKAVELYRSWGPDEVIVEWQASGYSIVQELQNFKIPVKKFKPAKHGDKKRRAVTISGLIEGGLVWIPSREYHEEEPADFAEKMLEAAKYFPVMGPSGDTIDIIDSMSQALIFLAERYELRHQPIVPMTSHDILRKYGLRPKLKRVNITKNEEDTSN